jgi:NADH:ubiquinone oxidoreductase subunit 5 (subunit L)/multisubunit Na+/H+ antiporter MnhA subunit
MFVSFDKFLIYTYQANKAALKAMIINRLADVFFILGIICICFVFQTADYIIVFSVVGYVGYFVPKVSVLGAATKSAQIGLHV